MTKLAVPPVSPPAATAPRWRVSLELDPTLKLAPCSYVYSPLLELAAAGALDLSIAYRPGDPILEAAMEVLHPVTGVSRRLVFDSHDRSYVFSLPQLRAADLYFKRCYHRPDVDVLEPALRAKIRPAGPFFMVGTPSARLTLTLGALTHALSGANLKTALKNLSFYLRLPAASAFISPPDHPRREAVFLQARLWGDSEVSGEPPAAAINAERIALVRALKTSLRDHFVGGILDTPLARELCPDLICHHNTSRRAYLQTMHHCRLGVYLQGLHHSTAYKLGEYLAASLGLVTSGLRNSLSHPLEEGRNLLTSTSLEECVHHCHYLLNNPDLTMAMSEANAAYYNTHASPTAHLKNCLKEAFYPGD